MPRAFPNSPHAMRLAKDDKLRALVDKAGYEKKIRKKHIAEAVRCSPASMTNKMKNPETITLGELRRMRELLRWGTDELDQII